MRWFSGYLLSPPGRNLLFLAAEFSLWLVPMVAQKTLCCASRELPLLFAGVTAVALVGVPGGTPRECSDGSRSGQMLDQSSWNFISRKGNLAFLQQEKMNVSESLKKIER